MVAVEAKINAPIDAVWTAYTTPDDIKRWNAASDDWHTAAARVDLRVGGEFSARMEARDGSFGFDFAGTYTKIIPHRLIEYTFGERSAKVEFVAAAGVVTVRVTFEAETTHSIEQQRSGWQAILDNFKRHVERTSVGGPVHSMATAKNTICLWYARDAEAAARFYAETFPNSSVGAVHRAPGDNPSSKEGDVLTVDFTVLGIPCIGLNGGPGVEHTWAFSFQVATNDQAETDRYWNAIVGNGGQESQCGWCKDRWGINWQITPTVLTHAFKSPDRAAAKRAFEAMMRMKKIDVAAIEAACRG